MPEFTYSEQVAYYDQRKFLETRYHNIPQWILDKSCYSPWINKCIQEYMHNLDMSREELLITIIKGQAEVIDKFMDTEVTRLRASSHLEIF